MGTLINKMRSPEICYSHFPTCCDISFIKNYVALQKARKEENLSVILCVGEEVKGFLIAPLLFIAFIENAFKYVSNSDERENCVKISFQKQEDMLIFSACNSKESSVANNIEHKGIGIANAKRRLALIYPQKHELTIKESDDYYEVTLKLQLV